MEEQGKTKAVSNTVVVCLSPYYGGMEMDALRLARLLSATSSITLIVKHGAALAGYCKKSLVDSKIRVESIQFRYYFSFAIIRQVRSIIKKNKIKNVIYFGASELRSLYFALLGLEANLIIRHGTTKSQPKKDAFHRLIYRNVKYHVAICNHLARNVEYIIPFGINTKLTIIYSSIENKSQNIRSPGKISPDTVVNLLHVGRFAEGKGQIDAIMACEELYERGIEFSLKLVGSGDESYVQKLRSILENKAYKESIHLENFTEDLNAFYREADIFLFPSEGEGLSNSFIDALSYGLVCIAYDNTSFPELRDLGFKLFLAKNLDLDALKAEISIALDFLYTHEFPNSENVSLSKSFFTQERELKQFIDILI
ncbi:MAG: glycosyltransferase family 4 protein [Thiohalomonadales bacterium]